MWTTILGAVLPAIAQRVFRGGGGNPASSFDMGGSLLPSQVPLQPQAQNQEPFGRQLLAGIADAMPSVARALSTVSSARLSGQATRAFNDEAYPGTTPWEQLGGGAAGQALQAASQADEMRQRERESRRVQETQISLQRMQAVGMMASAMAQNNGVAGMRAGEQMLRASGILTPAGSGVDYGSLQAGAVEARTAADFASARQSGAQADYIEGPQTDLAGHQGRALYAAASRDLTQSDLNRLQGTLNVMDQSIRVFETQNGRRAREIRSVVRIAGQGLAAVVEELGAESAGQWLRSTIVDGIADEMGSEYADEWQRILDDLMRP